MKNVISIKTVAGIVCLLVVTGLIITGNSACGPMTVAEFMERYASGVMGIFCLGIGHICR